MKNLILLGLFLCIILSCNSSKTVTDKDKDDNKIAKINSDTVRIANDEYDYEVIIIDNGFTSWLAGRAKPRGFYSEFYLESKNQIYVPEWNNRVLQPMRYNPNLYEMQIDYNNFTHYGYEVNYLLYNYFVYFQEKYNQNLGGFPSRP